MESVERTITELGTVFQQLAEMIAAQSEKVERIDANVEQVVRFWRTVFNASGL
jgi:syntaxin 5